MLHVIPFLRLCLTLDVSAEHREITAHLFQSDIISLQCSWQPVSHKEQGPDESEGWICIYFPARCEWGISYCSELYCSSYCTLKFYLKLEVQVKVCMHQHTFEESAFITPHHVPLSELYLDTPEYYTSYNFHSCFFHILGRHTQTHICKCKSCLYLLIKHWLRPTSHFPYLHKLPGSQKSVQAYKRKKI